MFVVEDSIALRETPERIWRVLVDVPRWWRLYYGGASKYKDYGWSEELKCLGGEGAGLRFGALREGVVMQTMHVSEWQPPTALTLASDPWNPEKASVSAVKGWLGAGRWRDSVSAINAVRCELRLTLTPESPTQTRLTAREEFEFLNPFLDLLLYFPAKAFARKWMTRFVVEFPKLL